MDNNWCMKDIPLVKNSNFKLSLHKVIEIGRNTIENILMPINQTYKCNVFRAGGFNILPTERIIPVLLKLGFIADSSVYPGGEIINIHSNIRYSQITNTIPFWFINDKNVLNQKQIVTKDSLIELPIFAYPITKLFKYDFNRFIISMKNKKSSLKTFKINIGNTTSLRKYFSFIEKEYLTWDYCLFNLYKTKLFINVTKKIQKHSPNRYHPFILIGHSKSFHSDRVLKYLLRNKSFRFITLTTLINRINS